MRQNWDKFSHFKHADYCDETSFQTYVTSVHSSTRPATIDVIEAFQMLFQIKIFMYVYEHDEVSCYSTSEVASPKKVILYMHVC